MKITIYVNKDCLEGLNRFLYEGQPKGVIDWFHDRPHHLSGEYFMVTITYDEYIKLKEF